MKNWLSYFQYNRVYRRVIPWENGVEVEPRVRKHLIRSLQRFQVGESGEGTHLRKQARTFDDPVYEQAIDLFIKEEQEHARLMGEILTRLKAPLLKKHWSDACFILLRRLFGLNHELLVLLVPEDGTEDEVVRAVCAQIMHDEEGHVAFHIDFLQNAFASHSLLERILLRIGWRLVFRAACAVLLVDHYRVLRACGVSAGEFWWDCGLLFDETAAAILNFAPTQLYARPAFEIREGVNG
jgi:hypothetical protein